MALNQSKLQSSSSRKGVQPQKAKTSQSEKAPLTHLSNHQDYHLVSCGGDAILRIFPTRRDEGEAGAQWLERMLHQVEELVGEESPLRQAIDVGLNQIEPERLWALLNAPDHVAKATFYNHASNLLVQELGLTPSPKPTSRPMPTPGPTPPR